MTGEKKPVVKVWFVKPKEAWYALSEEEKEELVRKETAVFDRAKAKYGFRNIAICDALWSTEDWMKFGMEEWSDIEAAREYAKGLEEMDFFRYFEARIWFGTPVEIMGDPV